MLTEVNKILSKAEFSKAVKSANEKMRDVFNGYSPTPAENAQEIWNALDGEKEVEMALEIANAAVGEIEELLVYFKAVDNLRNFTITPPTV